MSKDIKTKTNQKRNIKTFNRAVLGTQKIKNSIIKAKEEINTTNTENNEIEYTTNKLTDISNLGVYSLQKYGKASVLESQNNIQKMKIKYAKYKFIKQREKEIQNQINLMNEQQIKDTNYTFKIKKENEKPSNIKTKSNPKNKLEIKRKKDVINNALKSKKLNNIKTIQNSEIQKIKAIQPQKNVVENSSTQKIASYINKTKDTIKNASVTTKKAFEKVFTGLKLLTKGSKAIMMALLAGGWLFVFIIIITMLVGLFCNSVFGIFFANEGINGSKPLKQVIREVNVEFSERITDIQNKTIHDDYNITSNRAKIKDVIAVYTVKTGGADDGMEVITMNENKERMFKQIFWEMNKIDYHIETKREQNTIVDSKGKLKTVITTKKILHIDITGKTAYEMAEEYKFSWKQMKQLEELMSEKYANLWNSLIYGTSTGSGAIVEIAQSQIGNVGGQPYWSWYGFTERVSWCACFVSWCADQCGYIESGIVPKFSGCQAQGIPWFQSCGLWQDGGFTPNPRRYNIFRLGSRWTFRSCWNCRICPKRNSTYY